MDLTIIGNNIDLLNLISIYKRRIILLNFSIYLCFLTIRTPSSIIAGLLPETRGQGLVGSSSAEEHSVEEVCKSY